MNIKIQHSFKLMFKKNEIINEDYPHYGRINNTL